MLTAFASVAVAETILQVTGREATIKWPNDLLLGGKKTCGILIESGNTVSDSNSGTHFIVGIGLNVNHSADDFRRMDLPDATSLSIASGQFFDAEAVTQLLIDKLDENYERLLGGEIAAVEESWVRRLGKVGRTTTVELLDANELIGRLQQVSFDGLELELPNGAIRRLRPEEVRHLR